MIEGYSENIHFHKNEYLSYALSLVYQPISKIRLTKNVYFLFQQRLLKLFNRKNHIFSKNFCKPLCKGNVNEK